MLAVAYATCAKLRPKQASAPSPATALAGLPADSIGARLETSEGVIHCQLEPRLAPQAVALFVGLATGRGRWFDVRSQSVAERPMYRDLTFFRAVPDAFVQSGCPLGNGTGTPGYRIAREAAPDAAQRLARPGALLLVGYHAPPNRIDPSPPPPGQIIGSQFVIALGDLSHLASQVSVIGTCSDLERVRGIAERVAKKHTVQLQRVRIEGVSE